MPTPDTFPGKLVEELIELETNTNSIVSMPAGTLKFDGNDFEFKDGLGAFNPRSGGSGITESQHDNLDDLVHDIAETCDWIITRSGGKVSTIDIQSTSGSPLIRKYEFTRSAGKVSAIEEIQYNGAGTEIQRLSYTVTRTSGKVTSIRAIETGG